MHDTLQYLYNHPLHNPLAIARSASSIHPATNPIESSSGLAKMLLSVAASRRPPCASSFSITLVSAPQADQLRAKAESEERTSDRTVVLLRVDLLRRRLKVVVDGEDHLARHLVRLSRPTFRADGAIHGGVVGGRGRGGEDTLLRGGGEGFGGERVRAGEPGCERGTPPGAHAFPEDQADVGVVDRSSECVLNLRSAGRQLRTGRNRVGTHEGRGAV